MPKKTTVQLLILFIIYLITVNIIPDYALAFSNISDALSDSAPGVNANHTIIFKTYHEIPPSGKIIITPQAEEFFIMEGFGHTDMDLATSSARNGFFRERTLAALPDASADGATAVASSSEGSITITLNSTYGIKVGEFVRIKLGTAANYQAIGERQIINPVSIGSYSVNIEIFAVGNQLLDDFSTLIFINLPVTMTTSGERVRGNGRPTGILTFGTRSTILSLTTNYLAACRYSTLPNIAYDEMTSQFSYTGFNFHSVNISGLADGQHYAYYVKCADEFGFFDTTDYAITFQVAVAAGSGESEVSGIPGPGGGGSGGGGGGGIGPSQGKGTGDYFPFPPPPGSPSVILQGLAYPFSQVVLLKDSQELQKMNADSLAQFLFAVYDLKQGVYTFGVWAEDQEKRKSLTQSFTFWLKEGTKSEIYKIFIPPTIEASRNAVNAGETVTVFGRSAPGSSVEIWLYPQKEGIIADSEILKVTALSDTAGKWTANISVPDSFKGNYKIKARSSKEAMGMSDFSKVLDLAVGVMPGKATCPGADLNKDGKVNLFDFSILLYYWGTDNDCADQNQDGIVNLIDFSIMMYYWTG